MSSHSKGHLGRALRLLPATIAVLYVFSALAAAQDQPAPRWELFGGYSFLYPNADVHGTLPLGLVPLTSVMESNPRGAGAGVTYNFNRWFGFTLDASSHWGSGESTLGRRIDDAAFSNLSLGPKVTFRSTHFSPFLEALIGDHRLMPDAFHDIDKLGLMVGGGLDLNVSRHIALRLLRADFVMSNYRYGPMATTASTDLRGVRLQAGIVFMFGGKEIAKALPSASCSAQPGAVLAGEPVQVTATPSNFNPKRTLTYNWASTGGNVGGNAASTIVDTTGLAPGSYTVKSNISDGKNGMASCNADFSVKPPPAPPNPVISCSANPATVKSGDPSTVTCECRTGDGQGTATVGNWSSTAGNISGSGSSARLDTAGAAPGPITVSARCTDPRGPTANSSVQVIIENPPPPPQQSAMCSITFPNKKKPARVDNTAKACLDDVALRLQREADAKAVVIGNQDSTETGANLSADRALNTREYLTSEKGIDPGRISVMTGSSGEAKVDNVLVPPGATFSQAGTQPVTKTGPSPKPQRKAAKSKGKAAPPKQ